MTTDDKRTTHKPTSSASFKRLEDCIRHLWRLSGIMLIIIAILPTSLYFYMSMTALHERARVYASQLGFFLGTRLENPDPFFANFSSRIWEVMKNDKVTSVQLLGSDGEEVFQIGEPQQQIYIMTVRVQDFPPEHFVKTIILQHDVRPLFLKAARVFGVHLIVAFVLTLLVYIIPIRALQQAVAHVKAAHDQIIHTDKLRAIGEVYASLTHEINNPLSILLTRVKLLITSAETQHLSSPVVRDLQVIERHGTRIAGIIRQLLTFARKTPLEFERIDLNEVLKDAVMLVRKPFAKEGVQIVMRLTPDAPLISGSHNHLQQVVLNLLNNARDAMPQGGTLSIRTVAAADEVLAEIQDTGTGIPPEHLEKIFEPFFTTKKVGKGTGLGLSVSYGILRDHGGEIEVESTPGSGTTFQIRFPRQEVTQ
ncbi:hypothetical protein GF339_02505 [candidate division KSB3 bacterium]|uniref:histidine kinase n=1 Tax=candidate division KSB3 bacterium TaxID=2044937 RepID=A0A9D5JSR4_9BACT|nr:hypothetical protein [candidate division KSB3 bacterium]MBD3323425.1 hypothetical protein [candidate division KSB3 bacterium]